MEEEDPKLTARTLATMQNSGGPGKGKLSQEAVGDAQGLVEVKQLVQQKRVVGRELQELKAQLEKSGFSLTRMRKALFSLRMENTELKSHQTERRSETDPRDEQGFLEEGGNEEKLVVEEEDEQLLMVENAVRLRLESEELQERLMVSEATVEAQEEQLRDYRDLPMETSVQQDSKQVQVDLQDMGYETCGRSENEAEREETSSPEFDDLEMCTSLECGGSQWWSGVVHPGKAGPPTSTSKADDFTSLQRLVEDLRSQLSRSQTVIRSLQGRLCSLSTSSDPFGPSNGPSTPRKVNWAIQFQSSPSQSGLDEDEGWESSGGGLGPSPHHPIPDKDLQELVFRVGALEDQLRKGKGTQAGTPGLPAEGKASIWPGPGKFDTLIQAQARELSHLRQRMREGRGVCHILTQHLGDTTKGFEELLRANDIDYYMGQSFREQLAQSSALAQRVSTKISGRDHPEMHDDKTGTELLAIRYASANLLSVCVCVCLQQCDMNATVFHPYQCRLWLLLLVTLLNSSRLGQLENIDCWGHVCPPTGVLSLSGLSLDQPADWTVGCELLMSLTTSDLNPIHHCDCDCWGVISLKTTERQISPFPSFPFLSLSTIFLCLSFFAQSSLPSLFLNLSSPFAPMLVEWLVL
ncbi:unnamed protein product [Oncorhynchus mykiss]|uniref:Olduvai domain-containing protein n=1 Tax=Oncorhynchus mykiss TaxID=8022 RepID=A0A060W6X7_ONCMY|nr:unnamed protein product [Oncorhynchus mykiss]